MMRLNKTKEKYEKAKAARVEIKAKQTEVLRELVQVEGEHRAAKDRKIAIETCGDQKKIFKKENEMKEELTMKQKRNQNFEQLLINKQIKMIDKILAKETKCNEVSQSINNVRARIKKAIEDNEKLSEEVKSLKQMLPKPTLNVRNSPEKPVFSDERDLFSNQEMGDM
mmetsp:Transcript_5844/g.6834  ORF Transcript_5844/g.6834 Transcript_5844/m.6834 type:complete len:168 (-) Transcript_5844:17-520(-)